MCNAKWVIIIFIICLILSTNSRSENGTLTNKKNTISNKDHWKITIQVSSHKKAENAERQLMRLKSHDLDSFISHELVKDKGMWYRVYVGQFESRKAATTFAKSLVDKGIISGFWVKKAKVPVHEPKSLKARQPEIQEPTIETKKRKEKIETDLIKPTPPPSPIDVPEKPAPIEIPKPKVTEKIKTEEVIIESIVQEEETPTVSIGAVEKEQEKSRLSIGLKSSLSLTKKGEDFKITRTSGGDIDSWVFENTKKYGGLVVNFLLNDRFAIETSIERAFFTDLDLWQFSVGPKFQFRQIGSLTPFIRGGLVIGDLKWNDAPGDFDTGIGGEGGGGIYLIKSKLHIGFEMSYRQIKYSYNIPSGNEFAASNDHLDLSGFTWSGTLSYLF